MEAILNLVPPLTEGEVLRGVISDMKSGIIATDATTVSRELIKEFGLDISSQVASCTLRKIISGEVKV